MMKRLRALWVWLRRPEVIGPDECPIMHRWTIFSGHSGDSSPWCKLMVHHFLPNRDDRDVHDHPRPFITFVLRGEYEDLVPCYCQRVGEVVTLRFDGAGAHCTHCHGENVIVGERMTPGTIRRRLAHHTHRTRVGAKGCWTLVLMGPIRKPWGFLRDGRWWAWRDYEAKFGFGMRCEEVDVVYDEQKTRMTVPRPEHGR